MAIRTPAELKAAVLAMFADNNTGDIIPADARDFLDDQIDSAVPSVGGSDVLNEIRHMNGAWKAISTKSQEYMVLTRTDDFDTLRRAIVRGLQTGGGRESYESGLPSIFGYRPRTINNTGGPGASGGRTDGPISTMWPVGEAAPFLWLMSPSLYGYMARSTINFITWADGFATDPHTATDDVGTLPYTITIDGVPYDVGRNQTSLARPDPANSTAGHEDEIVFRFRYLYTVPPEAAPVVLQVL